MLILNCSGNHRAYRSGMPMGAVNPDALPATCEVRDWVVFGPGTHKGGFYSPAMCERVPVNFARLREHLTPVAKIGHDRQQRLAKSLGFINVGRVVAVKSVGRGNFALTVVDVPTAVGAEINAGRLNSGSVELLPKIADPNDPAKDIDGPVLTGVAFLGEEQPAVKGFDPPRAVFADGRPVPPASDPAPWLNAMADVTVMSAYAGDAAPRFHWFGREYAAQTICFSEMQPMDPKAQLAALGLSPEQIDQVLAICQPANPAPPVDAAAAVPSAPGAPAPVNAPAPMSSHTFGVGGGNKNQGAMEHYAPRVKDADGDTVGYERGGSRPHSAEFAATCKKFADDPNATPEQKMMAALFNSVEDMTKRFGALEAAKEADQKKSDEAQMAAFSATCEDRITKLHRKVPPAFIENVIRPAVKDIATARAFSSESDRLKAFSDLVERYEKMPDDSSLVTASKPTSGTGKGVLTPFQISQLNTETMKRFAPLARQKLLGAHEAAVGAK